MSTGFKPSSVLGLNSVAYLESMQLQFRNDPQAVDPGWRYVLQLAEDLGAGEAAAAAAGSQAAGLARRWAHLQADVNPLAPAAGDALARLAQLERRHGTAAGQGPAPSRQRLAEAYAGHLAVETGHIDDAQVLAWVCTRMEAAGETLDAPARLAALALLVQAEEFERFVSLRFTGKKKFGAEGSETMVVALDAILRCAAAAGVDEVVLGTMHRGRMNLLANVLGKDLAELLAEFKGRNPFADPAGSCADVPYHLGFEARLLIDGRPLALRLLPNPSHLEAVDPVVAGRVRALQDARAPAERAKVLGIVLHTDAAVIGQGLVSEVLQLSGVPGFATCGTVHLVVNNQLGFTTEPQEARTSRYCTAAWKALDAPILHVNGDEPEAVVRAAAMAVDFRQGFGRDVVIDLNVYRRNGHNEMDEPRFTQPLMYAAIEQRDAVAARYGEVLQSRGEVDAAAIARMRAQARARLEAGYQRAALHASVSDGYPAGPWAGRNGRSPATRAVDTGVPQAQLLRLLDAMAAVPAGMQVGSKLEALVRERRNTGRGIAWATAEALAFASLLGAGTPVRISGQDCVRGAFSQRHWCLTDTRSGERHITLQALVPGQARFTAVNSPLSEYATLGFEYGYSLGAPDALVIWEAQFGDFANGAQIIIDQFVASGEAKWRQPSGLVMLLPHGLEGQGPEHSSCRIERYLQLAAGGNICIANPSTPANYFHLLRRQVLERGRRPLVVVAPKTLLRLPAATSPLSAFAPGTSFARVIGTPLPARLRKLVLCSGKLAYALQAALHLRPGDAVAVLRLEQLYPLPREELSPLLQNAAACGAELVWAQEEPENMGAWSWYERKLEDMAAACGHPRPRWTYCGRPEAASPAGSFHSDHASDQAAIVELALA